MIHQPSMGIPAKSIMTLSIKGDLMSPEKPSEINMKHNMNEKHTMKRMQ